MIYKRSLHYLFATLGTVYGINQAKTNNEGRSTPPHQNSIEKSRDILTKLKYEHKIPGISIAVAVDGKPVWSEGLGHVDIENLVPCGANSVFRIGSISKPMTATVFARLCDQGRVRLDDFVSKYVPEWPEKFVGGEKAEISCRHILTHSSGVIHRKSSPTKGTEIVHEKYESALEVVGIFKDEDLLFKPGTKYSYSNYGFSLLAAVCEKVAEKPFPALLKELFLDLGLTDTYLDQSQPIILGRTRYYSVGEDGALVNSVFTEATHKFASSGILSSAVDLVKFGCAVLESSRHGGYLRKETVQEMWTPSVVAGDVGLGWFVRGNGESTRVVYHGGNTLGASCVLVVMPMGVIVAILANLDNVSGMRDAAERIALMFRSD